MGVKRTSMCHAGLSRSRRDGRGVCSCLVAVLGCLSALLAHPVAHATMPRAPVDLRLELGGEPAVGAEVEVTLRIRPLADAAAVALTLTLPSELELVAGETTWRGVVRAGQSHALTVVIRPREAVPATIQGIGVLEFQDGTKLGESRAVTLDLGPAIKQKSALPPSKKTQTGDPVIEYGP